MARRRHRRHPFALLAGAALLTLVAAFVVVIEARLAGDAVERRHLDAFYAQPADAADGAPGTLVRSEELVGLPFDARAWRVMYRTTDVHGDTVVSTGLVITPLGAAPAGGRTVLSWGHPTTGSAPDCAPSRGFDPYALIEGMRPMLDRGYTIAATDYVGMGTAGPDSYLVGDTGGNAVLDAVRAARQLPAAHASETVVLWGHSQGGQAVLFAAQRAQQYAPELDITGVAVAAPAADLGSLLSDHIDDISGVTIGSYAFAAYAGVYADRGATLESILTPEARAILPEMNEMCLLTNIDRLHEIGQPVVGHFVTADPATVEPWKDILAENSAGAVPFAAPLFVAQGLADELVVPSATEQFVARERAQGMDVSFHKIAVADHGTVA
ncbi:lipase family protein [Microbacterium sp. bgisy203]|uniref:lipase family protein n=1 Tax=Microbacterium sp. bgisy203 TaxID=3413799 RepID=UPI003D70F9F2